MSGEPPEVDRQGGAWNDGCAPGGYLSASPRGAAEVCTTVEDKKRAKQAAEVASSRAARDYWAVTHPALEAVAHRPWPLPRAPWRWRQSWCGLLFMHWPVPAKVLRPLVPEPLVIDEHDGTSWVGVVPFRMEGVMRRPWPDVPGLSAFPELNVRLYVQLDGRPGVWFLSLDATNALAVWAARRFFHLPYVRARMQVATDGGSVRYTSSRPDGSAHFDARYGPVSEPVESPPGTLEHFLAERYCLYARSPDGHLWRNEVHHRPWPLQTAAADVARNTYLQAHGLPLSGAPALLHFARRLDVVVWGAERVG